MQIQTRDDATILREVLAPIWSEYYRTNGDTTTTVSTNMCCTTAWMVHSVDPNWRVVHGEVDGHGHAWCEREDGTVLDVTGDQFGRPAVVWGELPVGYVECGRLGGICCRAAWASLPSGQSGEYDHHEEA